ncbi:hypothetical protein ACHHYP_07173 [Achlya hypogyna]|uniref:Uncharacterized protein n=1 Tax=Achlya hypogyna TaxID=1202772 RepID=A0A1V9ZMM4_ACHHY|nr:hypothetical protein ACHHYP_07173 [Achlya hypogyna]
MNAVWLSSLERDLMVARSHPELRPHTSSVDKRPPRLSKATSAKQLKPLVTKEEEARLQKKKLDDSHACWRAWCDEKNERIKEEKRLEREKERLREAEETKKARLKAQSDASFEEWKRVKSQERLARCEALLRDQKAQRELVKQVETIRLANVKGHLESIERVKKLTAKRRAGTSTRKKKKMNQPTPVFLHPRSLPVQYISHQADLEARIDRLAASLAAPAEIESHNLTMENRRFEKRLHCHSATRADSLRQLRHWTKPCPDVYILASLLYKIVALETPTQVQFVDLWRWLPWRLVRDVFQDSLVETLHSITIADLDPRSLMLLYLHCGQPTFRVDAIERRSVVGAALRLWVHNVAAVHELVDPSTQVVRAIDQLRLHAVSLHDIAHVVLLLHVYPYVNVQLKDRQADSDKQAQLRQGDLALLRELYALPETAPVASVAIALPPTETDAFSSFMGAMEFDPAPLPAEAPQAPRSKLAARLAARLQEHKALLQEEAPAPAQPNDVDLTDDFVVVYKLVLPKNEGSEALSVVNYMSEKRRDSVRRRSQQWTPPPRPRRVTPVKTHAPKHAVPSEAAPSASRFVPQRSSASLAHSTPSITEERDQASTADGRDNQLLLFNDGNAVAVDSLPEEIESPPLGEPQPSEEHHHFESPQTSPAARGTAWETTDEGVLAGEKDVDGKQLVAEVPESSPPETQRSFDGWDMDEEGQDDGLEEDGRDLYGDEDGFGSDSDA